MNICLRIYRKIASTTAILCLFVGLTSVPFAHAQIDLDRATRDVDRPVREDVEKQMREVPPPLPEIKEEPEKETEGPRFFAKKINLIGCETFPPEDFSESLSKYENKEVTLEDLNILAKRIERDYLRRGVISACFVPPQDVQEGIVELRVVEAHMGHLSITDHSFFENDMVKNYWQIRPGEVLRYDKMSRSLQIMNKNPDREVKATLKAGKKPKTTDVFLNVESQFPIHLTGSFDNEGSPSSGKERKGIGFRHNNFLFVDDILMYGYTYSTWFLGHYIYHRVPITNFATSVMYGYNFSKAASKKDYEFVGLNSRSENFSCFVYQDLFKKEEYIGEAYIGVDAKDKTVKQITGTTGRDRLRILRLGGNFIWRAFGGITYWSPEYSQGLNFLGARAKDRLTSRTSTGQFDGAENTFSKFNLDVTHKRPLPWNLQASLQLKGQVSSQKMASQEEFSLGGIDSVRGYPAGDFSADDAYQARTEVLVPAFFFPEKLRLPYDSKPLRDIITGVAFFDYVHGLRKGLPVNGPTRSVVDYASIGAGIRIRLYQQALLRFEWGFILPGATVSQTEAANSRMHISMSLEEKLPSEMKRVRKILDEDSLNKTARQMISEELRREHSSLRAKLYEYMRLAQTAQAENNLEEARKYYAMVIKTSNALPVQAREYIKTCREHQQELKKTSKLASEAYAHGDTEESKRLWEEVRDDSKAKELVFEL